MIAGIWDFKGVILKPTNLGKGGIFFLPQKSYLPLGTLREVIIYPHSEAMTSDYEIIQCMKLASIDYINDRFGLDGVEIWDNVLSPGIFF